MKYLIVISSILIFFSCSDNSKNKEDYSHNVPKVSDSDKGISSNSGYLESKLEFDPYLKMEDSDIQKKDPFTKKAGNVSYSLKQLSIRKFLEFKTGFSGEKLDSLESEMEGEMIFIFELSTKDQKEIFEKELTGLDFEESVKYASFKLQEDIYLVSGNDTIPCANAQLERTFKLTPFKRFLLNFGGVKDKNNCHLVYQDKLLKNGIVKFNLFKKKNNLES